MEQYDPRHYCQLCRCNEHRGLTNGVPNPFEANPRTEACIDVNCECHQGEE